MEPVAAVDPAAESVQRGERFDVVDVHVLGGAVAEREVDAAQEVVGIPRRAGGEVSEGAGWQRMEVVEHDVAAGVLAQPRAQAEPEVGALGGECGDARRVRADFGPCGHVVRLRDDDGDVRPERGGRARGVEHFARDRVVVRTLDGGLEAERVQRERERRLEQLRGRATQERNADRSWRRWPARGCEQARADAHERRERGVVRRRARELEQPVPCQGVLARPQQFSKRFHRQAPCGRARTRRLAPRCRRDAMPSCRR